MLLSKPLNRSFAIFFQKEVIFPVNVTHYSKYALSILFIFVIYLSYQLLKPLLLTIVTAILLVYVFSPVYNFLNTRFIKNKYFCSLVVLVCIFLLVSLPMVFLLHSLSQQGIKQYTFLKQFVSDPMLFECTNGNTEFCLRYAALLSLEDRTILHDFFKNAFLSIEQKFLTKIFTFISLLPSQLLEFFVMIFLMFFLFVDGKKLFLTVKNFLPMKIEHEQYLINTLKDTTDAVVFGQVFIAVLQGALAGIGFWILGIQHSILLGALITFLGVIPFLGPMIVWLPLALYYLISGIQEANSEFLFKGIVLLVYGILVLSTVENLLKPKIIGDKAKMHPALVFLGVIGGLSLFGFIGFFLGPIILSVFFTLVKIYEKEKLLQMKRCD